MHTIDIELAQNGALWGGPHFLWLTEDMRLVADFEPMVWLNTHARGEWNWQLVDMWNSAQPFDVTQDKLELFDLVQGINLHLHFCNRDDAMLFKLTWL